ncbi:MAG: HIRAN domain-containing protein [Proteobacteria bacterium]|nr:HIRAN domain-containing protein [Pseudomonadota bacterium]
MGRTFRAKIAGVIHNNNDGTSRQEILRKCSLGESLVLQRDYNNAFDEYAIAVLRKTREQVGFIPRQVAFRHPAMNDLAPHMDQGGEVSAKIVSLIGGECEIEIEVIGCDGGKPYQLREAEARDLRDKAKALERSDPKEAIRLYRQSIAKMLEVDSLIRETRFFKNQVAELGYDLGTWRRSSLPIERITALLERQKNYSECLEEISSYENTEDRKGLSQNDFRKIRERKRKVKRLFQPSKEKIDTAFLVERIKMLQVDPNRFHEEHSTYHSYDCTTELVSHYRAEIKHLGLGASQIITEFERDKLVKKVSDQFKQWDEEWLIYLQQDLAEGIREDGST